MLQTNPNSGPVVLLIISDLDFNIKTPIEEEVIITQILDISIIISINSDRNILTTKGSNHVTTTLDSKILTIIIRFKPKVPPLLRDKMDPSKILIIPQHVQFALQITPRNHVELDIADHAKNSATLPRHVSKITATKIFSKWCQAATAKAFE